MFIVDLWTDGSGTRWGNPGGWAYVLLTTHPTTGESYEKCESGFVSDATNNTMEMTALLRGLQALKSPTLVVVHTDSEYLYKPFVYNWHAKWERRAWHKVKNAELWKELLVASDPHMLSFEWVEGHSGVELNEECDKLAGMARRAAIATNKQEEANGAPVGH